MNDNFKNARVTMAPLVAAYLSHFYFYFFYFYKYYYCKYYYKAHELYLQIS